NLDVGTLSVVTVFVTALLGALLVFAGLQNRTIRAPMWWGAAQIICAIGLGLASSRGSMPDFVAIDLANDLILLAYGLTWGGAGGVRGRRGFAAALRFCPVRGVVGVALPLTRGRLKLADAGGPRHEGDAGGGARRGALARPRRAADVALAHRHRVARLCRH